VSRLNSRYKFNVAASLSRPCPSDPLLLHAPRKAGKVVSFAKEGCVEREHFLGFRAQGVSQIRKTPQPRSLILAVVSAFLLCIASVTRSADDARLAPEPPLVTLALAKFRTLTRAERAVLEFADVGKLERGEFAVAGNSANPADPSNDPAHADKWDVQRNIRAGLIRWMSVDPDAIRLIDPQGIRVIGARIAGTLDLSQVHVPFGITLRNCAIPEAMELSSAEISSLDLSGSYTGSIHAQGINVTHQLSLAYGFHMKGIVNLQDSALGGFGAMDGHFKYAEEPGYFLAPYRMVLNLLYANIKSTAYLVYGFEADGGVSLFQAKIGGDLACDSGHFFNPGNVAFEASSTEIVGNVFLTTAQFSQNAVAHGGSVKVNGLMHFAGAHVGSAFLVDQVIFSGSAGQLHGLSAPEMSVRGLFLWRDVTLENSAQLDLSGASLAYIIDQRSSWPAPGNLLIDGLTYSGFQSPEPGDAPGDAATRLRWIGLQSVFHPQPYRQLAKALRESGDDSGAIRVLIAEQDAQYQKSSLPRRLLASFLKTTIGYGHQPLLAILWSALVVLLGWQVVSVGARAGVMAPTWPENRPAEARKPYEKLSPLLYSLDVFVPFVNLHQEHYWWPDADAEGQYAILGRKIRISGRMLRRYLWLQIIAGWLLSAIFVAGITGLMRND